MKVLNANLVQKETNNDPLLSKVKYYISNRWPEKVNKELEVFRHKQELLSLEQNTILWRHRIVRPMPGKTRIHTWEWPQNPWQRLHADFLGPFKEQLFLIIEDAYSKWLEVFKVPATGAQYSIDIFRNLFARYGLPEYLVTANSPPFTSVHFQQFLRDNGIGHRTSSAYYPQSN
ncbi:Ribonuclease H-like domain,Integrase, catalytic core [Cinara cedri]|uniref:Ribonuclease H-like domain,Integrase, catalytic core n=1 Tax=Cinara cedri TaxID=506608 RepID=A0A5E4NDR8_9HEMI|nr:Ribonuclease H-like domain,Integrase, catalytic core [Cinara cedri]